MPDTLIFTRRFRLGTKEATAVGVFILLISLLCNFTNFASIYATCNKAADQLYKQINAHRLTVRNEFKIVADEFFKYNTRRFSADEITSASQHLAGNVINFLGRAGIYPLDAYELLPDSQAKRVKDMRLSSRENASAIEEAFKQSINRRQSFDLSHGAKIGNHFEESKTIFLGLPHERLADRDVISNNHYMLVSPDIAYGVEAQRKLATATRLILNRLYEKSFVTNIESLYKQERLDESISFWRKLSDPARFDAFPPAIRAFHEGTTSIYQALVLLASHKIEGVNSLDELVKLALTDQRGFSAIHTIAMKLPPGIIGPVLQSGFKPKRPLANLKSGKLSLNRDFTEFNRHTRGWILKHLPTVQPDSPFTGLGCPLGVLVNRTSTLQDILNEFYRVYASL